MVMLEVAMVLLAAARASMASTISSALAYF